MHTPYIRLLSHCRRYRRPTLHSPPPPERQQFGNFQNHEEMQQCKRQRSQFGRFYYRFPDGESGLDVYTRVGAS